jgi:hypothetical protein
MSGWTNPLDARDLPLLEGENPDLVEEARATFGEAWLTTPNGRLCGRKPAELIKAQQGAYVRDLVRAAKYIGVS